MTKSADGRVTVRIEVVIEDMRGTVTSMTTGPCEAITPSAVSLAGVVHPRKITYPIPSSPPAPSDTPVYTIGGQKYIEAWGQSPVVMGSYPDKVWALAYPSADFNPPPAPPAGAIWVAPMGDGSWWFKRANGNPVPGANSDGTSGGGNNSTLAVWYDLGGSPPAYRLEITSFHGYQPGSSGGSGSEGGRILRADAGPALLHATFTGSLAKLGTVTLTWNGVSWAGASSAGGGCIFALQCRDNVCQLLSGGPGTAFIVAGPPKSWQPFSWTAEGTGVGALAGPFGVTLVE